MNPAQLTSIANSSRKMHILGIVENELKEDPMKSEVNDIGQVSPSIANVFLYNFSIAKVGMLVIKPLAMYYEI